MPNLGTTPIAIISVIIFLILSVYYISSSATARDESNRLATAANKLAQYPALLEANQKESDTLKTKLTIAQQRLEANKINAPQQEAKSCELSDYLPPQ